MITINHFPTRRELNWFGVIILIFSGIVGGLVWLRADSVRWATIVWSVGAGLALIYYALRPLRRPLYLAWMYAVFPIGWTVSHLLLAVIFYLVITPIGLVLRLFGHDPLKLRDNRSAKSGWYPRERKAGSLETYFRQS